MELLHSQPAKDILCLWPIEPRDQKLFKVNYLKHCEAWALGSWDLLVHMLTSLFETLAMFNTSSSYPSIFCHSSRSGLQGQQSKLRHSPLPQPSPALLQFLWCGWRPRHSQVPRYEISLPFPWSAPGPPPSMTCLKRQIPGPSGSFLYGGVAALIWAPHPITKKNPIPFGVVHFHCLHLISHSFSHYPELPIGENKNDPWIDSSPSLHHKRLV